ncbi:MAG: ClC family H(+)/Cl(-) exchange transporter [Treponema sp.]|jgi:H+/Cl- antiporter ClcA|nr:ClC family H(+)/Cl(-) exchange transporter [Treponema sp.]
MDYPRLIHFTPRPDSKGRIKRTLDAWYASRLAVIVESVIIGLAAGFVIAGFRFALRQADSFRPRLYDALKTFPAYWTVLWAFALAALGAALGLAARRFPMIKGSGIPQIKGSLTGRMALAWAPELPLKLITGIAGLGAGLSLGREGPSIQIAAYVGIGILTLFRRPRAERKVLVSAAAAAGLSAAFNAPLAGVLFALEEMRLRFSPLSLACAMGSSISAAAAASFFFGQAPVFDFRYVAPLPLRHIPWIILLGILCALLGDVFKRSLYLSQDFYQKLRIHQIIRPILPLLLSIPLGLYLYDSTGGGHTVIESLSIENRTLQTLMTLFVGKLLFTAVSYGSGASGGIFLPLLTCGALLGDLSGDLLYKSGFIADGQNLNYMILGMAAFFSAVVKAPVTGVALILEMSGNFNHLGSLVLASLAAFVTSELIASPPVYAALLERMLAGLRKSGNAAG